LGEVGFITGASLVNVNKMCKKATILSGKYIYFYYHYEIFNIFKI